MRNNIFGTIALSAVLFIAIFASLSSAIPSSIGDLDATGGYITNIEISAVPSYTNYWQGYYGVITTESSPVYDDNFNVSSPNISTIQKLELGTSVREGDYLLITSSATPPVLSKLKPGNTSKVDLITGSDSDSGTNTFTNTSTYHIPGSGITLTNVPTVYTFVNNSQQYQKFSEGLLEDDEGALFFVVPISSIPETGYDSNQYYFQFIVPNNATNPLTYYMYYVPASLDDVSSPPSHNGNRLHAGSFGVVSIIYNETTGQFEMTFHNNNTGGVFFKYSADILVNGVKIATFSEDVIHFIQSGAESGISYFINLENIVGDIGDSNTNVTVHVFLEYGPTVNSMNMLLFEVFDVLIKPFEDRSDVEILDITYDPLTRMVFLTLKNTGQIPSYVSSTIVLLTNDSEEMLYFDNPILLPAGDDITLSQKIRLTEDEMAENPTAFVRIRYGERPDRLFKVIEKEFAISFVKSDSIIPLVAILSIILIIVIGFIWWIKRR